MTALGVGDMVEVQGRAHSDSDLLCVELLEGDHVQVVTLFGVGWRGG